MRSQIYAKSLPMPLVYGLIKRLELIQTMPMLREKLWEATHLLQRGLKEAGVEIGNTETPVTPVYLNGSIDQATSLVRDLRENYHIFCSMVVYPVVPQGIIILRLIPTAIHTPEDVQYTIGTFRTIKNNLASGKYDRQAALTVN